MKNNRLFFVLILLMMVNITTFSLTEIQKKRLIDAKTGVVFIDVYFKEGTEMSFPTLRGSLFSFPVNRGSGSGFFITRDGYIITNAHVVDNYEKVLVTTYDNKRYDAKVIGIDVKTDVAVIKIEGNDFNPLEIGTPYPLQYNKVVYALGYPLGIGYSVTMGRINTSSIYLHGYCEVEKFIQYDASINPGNSGGCLVDENAKIIAINTLGFHVTKEGIQSYKLNFGIPIDLAMRVAKQFIQTGKVVRPFAGIVLENLKRRDRDTGSQIEVTCIFPNSPAADAEFQEGDIIYGIDSKPVKEIVELMDYFRKQNIKISVVFKVKRGKEYIELEIVTGQRPDPLNIPGDFLLTKYIGINLDETLTIIGFESGSIAQKANVPMGEQIAYIMPGQNFPKAYEEKLSEDDFYKINTIADLTLAMNKGYLDSHFAFGLVWGKELSRKTSGYSIYVTQFTDKSRIFVAEKTIPTVI